MDGSRRATAMNPYSNKSNRKSFRRLFLRTLLASPFIIAVYSFFKLSSNGTPLSSLDFGVKPTPFTLLTEEYDFHMSWHPTSRAKRFVSTKDRIKIYLSNWYQPPCRSDVETNVSDEQFGYVYDKSAKSMPSVALNNREDQVLIGILDTTYNTEMPIALNKNSLQQCKNRDCQAAQKMLEDCNNYLKITPENDNSNILPILVFFGIQSTDSVDLTYPIFASYRSRSLNGKKSIKRSTQPVDCTQRAQRSLKNTLETVSKQDIMSPIIWDVYDMKSIASTVLDMDTSWGSKLQKAVWRGKLSGLISGVKSIKEKCKSNQRCQLIQSTAASSSFTDIGVTHQRAELPLEEMNLQSYVRSPLTIEEQLKYQIVIVVEGDGYATTLAWALYSNSVVIMPTPTTNSYLMEEMLEPWIHYIPCEADFSDLKKKIKWVLQNNQKAKKIAERATLWIHDLYMSDEAMRDNHEISEFVLERYKQFYVSE